MKTDTPKPNVVNSSFLHDYKSIMKESWQAKAFGITMPAYLVYMMMVFFMTSMGSALYYILITPISIWFVISYALLINRRFKDESEEIAIKVRNSYNWNENKS